MLEGMEYGLQEEDKIKMTLYSGSNLSLKEIYKKLERKKKHGYRETKKAVQRFFEEAQNIDLILFKKKGYKILERTKNRSLFQFYL